MKYLITGCGSFAKAMTKQLIKGDNEVILFSRNEKMQVETKRLLNSPKVTYLIGDIREYGAINEALKGVDICLHSAAMKHVDKCELQPLEAIKTNIIGSKNVIIACINNKVKKLVCLSTDKAANAETCYGMTKYAMEKIALGVDNKDTDIIITRYGNVMGSSGSVIPLFKDLEAQGKPLTITNRDMTRFFMPMFEAIELVLYAIDNGKNGDMFVCKNKSATVGMIADCISENQVEIGTRCIEKNGEALLTVAELNHSEDLGRFYRVNKSVCSKIAHTEPLTSDNAEKYTMKELQKIIKEL